MKRAGCDRAIGDRTVDARKLDLFVIAIVDQALCIDSIARLGHARTAPTIGTPLKARTAIGSDGQHRAVGAPGSGELTEISAGVRIECEMSRWWMCGYSL